MQEKVFVFKKTTHKYEDILSLILALPSWNDFSRHHKFLKKISVRAGWYQSLRASYFSPRSSEKGFFCKGSFVSLQWCIEEAVKFQSIGEFQNSNKSLYNSLVGARMAQEVSAAFRRHRDAERAKDDLKADKEPVLSIEERRHKVLSSLIGHTVRTEWRKKVGRLDSEIIKLNLTDAVNKHFQDARAYQLKALTILSARKYLNLSDWKKNHRHCFLRAQAEGYLSDCTSHMLSTECFVESRRRGLRESLLRLASEGSKRPSQLDQDRKTVALARALTDFTSPLGGRYDSEFHIQLASLRPDWFTGRAKLGRTVCRGSLSNKVKSLDFKEILLSLARRGASFEDLNQDQKKCFYRYTNSNNPSLDPEFTNAMKRVRPEWFVNTVKANKKSIENFILKVGRAPSKDSINKNERVLGRRFANYTCQNSTSFDSNFRERVAYLRRMLK